MKYNAINCYDGKDHEIGIEGNYGGSTLAMLARVLVPVKMERIA